MTEIPFSKTRGNVKIKERLLILDRKQRHAVLATDADGKPYTSLVAFALTADMKACLFATPKKTGKFRNIMKNKNVALMIDTRSNSASGYMHSEAVTIMGTARPLRRGRKRDELAAVFTKKHPRLSEFVNAPSTSLVLIHFERAIHAGGFQKVTEWIIKT
jgi:nitroimidazol reductase NimA-like FMN-containing flavoprotein (pyridoxamine 5'-phosphate oxidase superfamily)